MILKFENHLLSCSNKTTTQELLAAVSNLKSGKDDCSTASIKVLKRPLDDSEKVEMEFLLPNKKGLLP